MKHLAALTLSLMAQAGLAFEPDLPSGARQLADEERARSYYELPLGPFRDGQMDSERIRGLVRLQSWRIEGQAGATLEIGEAIAAQLVAAGYEPVFSCDNADCGGFDFRFETLVLPPPDMFVDLAEFRFLSARRPAKDGTDAVGLMVSRTTTAATIQLISVTSVPPVALDLVEAEKRKADTAGQLQTPSGDAGVTSAPPELSEEAGGDTIAQVLADRGHVVLTGLSFETGSSTLAEGPFPSLEALAAWLEGTPDARIALVGHTDNTGALDRNIALSRARATSVLEHLIGVYGVSREQIEAHGIGYLAPISSNEDPAGRETNRRVDAVLLPSS